MGKTLRLRPAVVSAPRLSVDVQKHVAQIEKGDHRSFQLRRIGMSGNQKSIFHDGLFVVTN